MRCFGSMMLGTALVWMFGVWLAAAAEDSVPAGSTAIEGRAVQILAAGRYVYVEVARAGGTGTLWVAAVAEPISTGDVVHCTSATLMEGFQSPLLKRTFDRVYFVGGLRGAGAGAALPAGHPAIHAGPPAGAAGTNAAAAAPQFNVPRPDGGVTLSELATDAAKHAGTEVVLRAVVTKYNAEIMDTNWLHVRDGSSDGDLVVTSRARAAVGDRVLIRGRLERNVDLGHGYRFALIIRDANVTVEEPAVRK